MIQNTLFVPPSRSSRVSAMSAKESVDEILQAQDWSSLLAQLTFFAWKRTHRRSWELARDLAQDAIATAFAHGAWDPAREPLRKFLFRTVIGLSLNEWRRKRNSLEIALGDDETDTVAAHAASPESEMLQRQWLHALVTGVEERVRMDAQAITLLQLTLKGIDLAREQVQASELTLEDVRRARRRLFDAADAVAKELGGPPMRDEVLQ